MKTLEFKLRPNKTQQQLIDTWLDELRWVWNRGLSLLEEEQQRRWRKKLGRPLPEGLRLKSYRGKFTGSGILKTREGFKYCPIREHRDIEDPKKQVGKIQTNLANPDKPWLHSICSRVRNGVVDDLLTAWKAYRDPKNPARKPLYKGKRGKLKSIKNQNASTTCSIVDKNHIKLPILGVLKAKGIGDRLKDYEYSQVRILKEAGEFYLQVTIRHSTEYRPPKYPDEAVGLDPGVVHAINRSDGWTAKNHRFFHRKQKRLAKLQRKAARQQKGSKNQAKTFRSVAKLHAKIKRQRRANNHKLSTTLVQTFGGIAIEANKFGNMTRSPKPKLREDGKGWARNGAAAKAGLNKSLLDVGGYQLRNMIEAKSKQHCEFHAVESPYNSQTCAKCGAIDKESRVSQSEFVCTACQHSENADVNAAQVVQKKAPWTREYRTTSRRWDAVKASETKNGTPLSRRNRKPKRIGKPAPESSVDCQQELAAPNTRFAQAGTRKNKITRESLPTSGKPHPKPSKRKRSAQLNPEYAIQLELWTPAGEIDFLAG